MSFLWGKYIYIYAFSRRFYPKRLTIAFRLYIFISTCVPWESNPQPFAQQTQCSTTEPHRNTSRNAPSPVRARFRCRTITHSLYSIKKTFHIRRVPVNHKKQRVCVRESVCVCLCECLSLCVCVYEVTNKYNDMGMKVITRRK